MITLQIDRLFSSNRFYITAHQQKIYDTQNTVFSISGIERDVIDSEYTACVVVTVATA